MYICFCGDYGSQRFILLVHGTTFGSRIVDGFGGLKCFPPFLLSPFPPFLPPSTFVFCSFLLLFLCDRINSVSYLFIPLYGCYHVLTLCNRYRMPLWKMDVYGDVQVLIFVRVSPFLPPPPLLPYSCDSRIIIFLQSLCWIAFSHTHMF